MQLGETALRSCTLTNTKHQAVEAELRRVKAYCVGALLPSASAQITIATA
jgi:hypothetical protein